MTCVTAAATSLRAHLVPVVLILALSGHAVAAAPLTGSILQLEAYGGGDLPVAECTDCNAETSFGTGSGQASASTSFGAGNAGLHATASASSPPGTGETYGDFDLYYNDTFNIAGSGQQIFAYTLHLAGSAITTYADGLDEQPNGDVNEAHAALGLFVNSSYVTWGTVRPNADCVDGIAPDGNSCGNLSGYATLVPDASSSETLLSGQITLLGGTSADLGLFMSGRTLSYSAFNGSNLVLSDLNVADTGWLTLTPLTPGAAFTTASGLTYSADPDSAPASVPEPGSAGLLASAFAVVWASRRRRLSATAR
jgi:hypothetical protein